MQAIGSTRGGVASYTGSVIVTTTRSWQASRWTNETGLIGIGDLPGGDVYSIASGISNDGSVIIGQSKSGSGFEAYRWTETTGMIGLGDLPGGTFDSRGFGVSNDGQFVVGQSTSTYGREAFLWTESSGMIGLGSFEESLESSAYAITDDGSIVVGRCYSGRDEAFMWTEATGMIGLGDLPGGIVSSWARDVTGDGSIIIGCSQTDIGWESFIWDQAHGMRNLEEILESDYGLDLTGWTLTWASGISDDGTVIVGRGYNPAGEREAWVATIPEPTTFLLLGLGGLMLRKRRQA